MRDENFIKDMKVDNLNYTLLGVDLANSDAFTVKVRDDATNHVETITIDKDDLHNDDATLNAVSDLCTVTHSAFDVTLKDMVNDKELLKTTVCVTDLPTESEFIKANEPSVLWYKHEKWSQPKYICPKCNEGGMRKENDVVYTSNPPCYKYQCDKCGNTTWHHF